MVSILGAWLTFQPPLKHHAPPLQPSNKKFKAYFRAITHPFANWHLSCLVRSPVILFRKKKLSSREASCLKVGWGKDHPGSLQKADNSKNSKCKSWAHLWMDSITTLIALKKKGGLRNKTIYTCGKHQLYTVYLARHWSPLSQKTAQGCPDIRESIHFVQFYSKDQLRCKSMWQQDLPDFFNSASPRETLPLTMNTMENIMGMELYFKKKNEKAGKENAGCMLV